MSTLPNFWLHLFTITPSISPLEIILWLKIEPYRLNYSQQRGIYYVNYINHDS